MTLTPGGAPRGGGRAASCVVCGATGPDVLELRLAVRSVWLCRRHTARAREAAVRTFSDLRRVFVEVGGNRSLLPRRQDEERRQLPARPEGRRLGSRGRRNND